MVIWNVDLSCFCHKKIRRFTWYVVHQVLLPLSEFSAAVPPLGMQAEGKKIRKPKRKSIIKGMCYCMRKKSQSACPIECILQNAKQSFRATKLGWGLLYIVMKGRYEAGFFTCFLINWSRSSFWAEWRNVRTGYAWNSDYHDLFSRFISRFWVL